MKKNKEELKKYFESGDKPTQEQYANLIDSYIDAKQPEGEANRRFVIDETGEVDLATELEIPQYQAGTNITIDETDPKKPVINVVGGGAVDTSKLVPYVGATSDLNLGNHHINLGKEVTVAEKNKAKILLTSDDIPFFKLGTDTWTGTSYVQDFGRSIAIGRETLDNYKGSGNIGLGRRTGYNLEGSGNQLLGMSAGENLKGNQNVVLGFLTARNLKGLYNVQLGYHTGSTTTGNHNIGIGFTTGYSLMGNHNIGIGNNTANALLGDYNTLIGSGANGYETPRDLSKKYVVEASNIAPNAEITITNHGFPVGSRKMFYYERDTTDSTSETLVNIGWRSTNASVWEVIDENTLKCLTESYVGNAVGRHTFTEFLPINNSTAIGNGAKLTKSNQMVLGDNALEEITTKAEYKSTRPGKGLVLTTPDGTKQYRISIDNSGSIVTTLI